MRILEEECPRWKTIAKTLGCVHACCTPGSEVQIGSEDARNEQSTGRCIGDDVRGGGTDSVRGVPQATVGTLSFTLKGLKNHQKVPS